ncbi:hypothetical protein WOLCODRAFT_107350 [Wolfiporia cocos MD-104 SS10]|uniref:Large ribosomal subunit protein mL59 domain-containing protein n=1 Tax=Wolfiporia cocos (strain MD-104) TaxID=742152 RepID=A0A2H3JHA1_WOLCO|nr:hypothetical protein WOLCODRAFT_107350 [Wolfiporia cocos MD-104 SS10]
MAAVQLVKRFRLRELASITRSGAQDSASIPKIPNPFLPHKNPESGRWAPPKYSLRRQAELIKQARASNTLHLLPPGLRLGPKALQGLVASPSATPTSETEGAWTRPVEWEGEVKEKADDVLNRLYAGRRRMFKGHKWERTLEKRKAETEKLMRSMPLRIQRFKETYRRKMPNPASPPRSSSYTKLPF